MVAETYDGFLNDIGGFHVTAEHAYAALDTATGGPVIQGNVGGGTGMIVAGFKGGIGTASRVLDAPVPCTVGVLVQANFGAREDLMLLGVPVGLDLSENLPQRGTAERDGSIIIVVGTDAPLLPHQLKRLARRAALGLARTGSVAHNGSGATAPAICSWRSRPLCRVSKPESNTGRRCLRPASIRCSGRRWKRLKRRSSMRCSRPKRLCCLNLPRGMWRAGVA